MDQSKILSFFTKFMKDPKILLFSKRLQRKKIAKEFHPGLSVFEHARSYILGGKESERIVSEVNTAQSMKNDVGQNG